MAKLPRPVASRPAALVLALCLGLFGGCTGARTFSAIAWEGFVPYLPARLADAMPESPVPLAKGGEMPFGGYAVSARSWDALLAEVDRRTGKMERCQGLLLTDRRTCDGKVHYEQSLRRQCQENRALICAACAGAGAGGAATLDRGLDELTR